jgi:hypothetical protein
VNFKEMATAGTLLSDLDTRPPVLNNKDDDLVNKILADMNIPMSGGNKIIQSPNTNTMHPVAMDPATATAHMIGKDFPSPADFSNAMHTPNFTHSPYEHQMQQPTIVMETRGNYYTDIISQLKQPILVAIIIFMVSMPALNVLLGYYVPSLLRLGGDLTMIGLAVRSLIGGFLFWFIQKILVPLMI